MTRASSARVWFVVMLACAGLWTVVGVVTREDGTLHFLDGLIAGVMLMNAGRELSRVRR